MKKVVLIIAIIVFSLGVLAGGGYFGYMFLFGEKTADIEKDYNAALLAIENKDYITAYETLIKLGDYKESSSKLVEIDEGYRRQKLKTAEVGDTVIIGEYEQDADFENGKESLEWVVIDKKDGKILLLTKYAIYNMMYHSSYQKGTTWKNSEIRKWCNGTFYEGAFSTDEKNLILETSLLNTGNPYEQGKDTPETEDKVFLLSLSDAETYFKSDEERMTKATEYAEYFGAFSAKEKGCWWWLRTNGLDGRKSVNITRNGAIDTVGAATNTEIISVRPAMWVNIEG